MEHIVIPIGFILGFGQLFYVDCIYCYDTQIMVTGVTETYW
jgi:hypothetical protein